MIHVRLFFCLNQWTGSLDAFQSLSGYLLYLDISCDSFTESTSCAVVKMAGTRGCK